MKVVANTLSASSDLQFKSMGGTLGTAVLNLERAVEWVLDVFPKNPAAAMAGAYPLLKCFGLVCGGWLLGRSALIAARHIATGSTDPFYPQKIGVASFYSHHVLTGASGLSQAVRLGEEVCDAMAHGLNDILN